MRLIDADAFREHISVMGTYSGWNVIKEIDARPTIEIAPIVRCKNCTNLFSCYKWPTEDILNNFCQDGEFGENGYETD